MTTRAQARQQERWEAYQTARRAHYANDPGTGYMPPEACYAPVRPGPAARVGGVPRQLAF